MFCAPRCCAGWSTALNGTYITEAARQSNRRSKTKLIMFKVLLSLIIATLMVGTTMANYEERAKAAMSTAVKKTKAMHARIQAKNAATQVRKQYHLRL